MGRGASGFRICDHQAIREKKNRLQKSLRKGETTHFIAVIYVSVLLLLLSP
jgi:hypothetical protein